MVRSHIPMGGTTGKHWLPKFIDWKDFRDKFKREFCPVYADSAAINRLESTAYFQKNRSVDEYLDEFQDLIMEAGYSDEMTTLDQLRKYVICDLTTNTHTQPNQH